MHSALPRGTPRRLPRWPTLLAACVVPLLAQAQNCTSPNTDGDYILGTVQGQASAMHWPTGLVWKRCIEGEAFGGGQCSTNAAQEKNWNDWTETQGLLPKSFDGQASWGISAGFSQNLLESGAWRMAYRSELEKIIEGCDDDPKVNRTVFPDTPSWVVWSGSPYADVFDHAWVTYFERGEVGGSYRSDARNARLVRGGQPFADLTSPAAQDADGPGAAVIFPSFPLARSGTDGQAWGGARISGDGSPAFQINGAGAWVQEAIVKSGDQITVRLTASSTVGDSRSATFTLRSGQTTGTSANATNGGNEATAVQTTTASFTANVVPPVPGACGSANGGFFTSAPSTNLCSAGVATSVAGTGPWNWNCTGQHGGSDSPTCTASLQTWAVTASASPAQGGTVTCSPASVAHDGSATCTATASMGYQFTGWMGACAGQTITCTLSNVTAAQDSTAQFAQSQYAVTASASPAQGGTVTCSPASVAHGGSATCTATASTGYQFTGWTGACASQGASCALANVTAAQDSVAQFTQNTLPVPEGPQAGEPLAVVVQPANGWQLTQASTQTVASLHAPALPPGVTLPQGVVRLRLALGTQGSEATVVLTYPQALPAGTVYYKFGKTQDNQQLHWYPFPGAQVSGNTITLTLKDGGAGDDDLQQNSVIDDPGGPALLAASSPASIPTLGEWALALLAAALGLFSLGALRRANASRRV